jgi:hypothetical protein
MGEQFWKPEERGERTDADEDLPPDLQAVVERYAAYPVPRPTSEATTHLVAQLLAEESAVERASASPRTSGFQAVYIARWRVRVLAGPFWVASVLLLLLGAVLSAAWPAHQEVIPLVLLAPLAGVFSLAHAVRSPSAGLRAVEASCPVSVVQTTAGLALAIVGFDCLLGGLATALLALLQWAPFAVLLTAWLGPLLLLTGVSLPVALRWGAFPAAAVGGGPWLLLAGIAWLAPQTAVTQFFALPQDQVSVLLHLLAAVLGSGLLFVLLVYGTVWSRPLRSAGEN